MDKLNNEIDKYEKEKLLSLSGIGNSEIGRRIKGLLRKERYTQQFLADKLPACTKKRVSEMLGGKTRISYSDIARIAMLLDTTIQYLVTGEGGDEITKCKFEYSTVNSNSKVGLRIKELLKKRRWTQQFLADTLPGCNKDSINSWIKGKISISYGNLASIAYIFHTTIDFLLLDIAIDDKTPAYNDFESLNTLEAAKLLLIDIPCSLPVKMEMKENTLTYTITCDKYVGSLLSDIEKRLRDLQCAKLSKDTYKAACRDIISSYLEGDKEETLPILATCKMPIVEMGECVPIENGVPAKKLHFDSIRKPLTDKILLIDNLCDGVKSGVK